MESSTSLRKLLSHLFSFGLEKNITNVSLNVFCVQVGLYINLFIQFSILSRVSSMLPA